MIRERVKRLIAGERKTPPERAVNIPAVRRTYSGIRKAYCKTDAGAGATITCYLDSDSHDANDEITVNCEIADGGTALNEAIPRLSNGEMITVWNDSGTWRSIMTFQKTGTC